MQRRGKIWLQKGRIKLMDMKKIKSWNLVVEWEHSNDTWNNETIEQDSIDKTTFKSIEKFLKEFAKIENDAQEN